jgi:potassium-transporting ATPase KdpC subunit
MTPLWNNFKMFLWLTLITGFAYPLLITLIAQLGFSAHANGGFIVKGEKNIGATLIAQKFESPKYFWGRPSAVNYNPLPSGASNLSPTSAKLKSNVDERLINLAKANKSAPQEVPGELIFTSASGLDPHISPETAYWQIDRIVEARKLDSTGKESIMKLIQTNTRYRFLGFIGQPIVNVLLLNMALDELSNSK